MVRNTRSCWMRVCNSVRDAFYIVIIILTSRAYYNLFIIIATTYLTWTAAFDGWWSTGRSRALPGDVNRFGKRFFKTVGTSHERVGDGGEGISSLGRACRWKSLRLSLYGGTRNIYVHMTRNRQGYILYIYLCDQTRLKTMTGTTVPLNSYLISPNTTTSLSVCM